MNKFYLIIIALSSCFSLLAQNVTGTIFDKSTNEPIIGARIETSEGKKAVTNIDGVFKIQVDSFPANFKVTMTGFIAAEFALDGPDSELKVYMITGDYQTGTVVISASRRQQ